MYSSISDIIAAINTVSSSFNSSIIGLSSNVNMQLAALIQLVKELPTASIPPTPPTSSLPPLYISFNYSPNNMAIGEVIVGTLNTGTTAITSSVIWTGVPTGIVTLTDYGSGKETVKGTTPGTFIITATIADGRFATASGGVVGSIPTPPTGSLPTGSLPPTGSVPPTGSLPPTGSTPVVVKTVTIAPNSLTIAAGSTNKVTVHAFDASGKDITAAASASGGYTLASTDTSVLTVALNGTVVGMGPGEANIEVHVGQTVPHWVTWTVSGSALPPTPVPAPSGGFQAIRSDDVAATIGIGAHFSYTDLLPYGANQAKTIQLIKDSGFRWVRDGLNCDGPPPTINNPFWQAFQSLVSSGIKMVFVTQPQYLGNNKFDTTPYTQQGNIDFAITTLGASGILAFEGPNEVDNNNGGWGGIPAYGPNAAQFQTSMFNRVKSLAPSIKVTGLTVTSQFGASNVPDLSNVEDGQTMHPYPGGQLPANAIAGEKSFLGQYMNKANKPYWITETGYYTSPNATTNVYQPGISELAQAKYTPRLYLMSVLNNIAYTAIYEFIDEHADLTNAESNYGLVRNDGTPKPAYTAIKNMLSVITEKTTVGATFTPSKLNATFTGLVAPVQYIVMQKSNGRFIIALWQEVLVYDTTAKKDITNLSKTVSISLGQKFSTANIYTPLTSATPTSSFINPTNITLSVPDHVVFVELIP